MGELGGNNAVITVKNLSYSYNSKKALDNVSFYLEPSSYTAIVGSNGSGKSTLCRLICGLLEMQMGQVNIAPEKRIGLVFQSPKDQIVSSKVYRDTAFGPQNLKFSPDEVELRTIECLSIVELLDKAEAPSNALSLGQTQKLAMAGMLAVNPDILILDEATAMLDPSSRQSVFELLRDLNRKGITIIHITHEIEAVKEADKVIGLMDGKLFYDGSAEDFLDKEVFVERIQGSPLSKNPRNNIAQNFSQKTFSFQNVSFAYEEQKSASKFSNVNFGFINNVSFDLYKGTLTALTGPSGAGKSTLLELGAGLLEPQGGTIKCNEKPSLAQQNCAAALFEAFAADDVAFGPKNQNVKGKKLLEVVRSSMNKAGLPFEQYAERQSIALSGGEQRRLAIAGILAMNREVVFFDEPTAGLDGHAKNQVMNMLRSLADEGKTVLFTTHHQDEADFSDRQIKMENGVIVDDSLKIGTDASEEVETQNKIQNLVPYSSTALLKGLKSFSFGISGSGWKTKCRLEKLQPFARVLLFLVLFVLSLVFKTTIPCVCMLAVSVIYCLFANFSFKKIVKSVLKILPFLCFFAIFQLVFRPPLADEIRYTSWRFLTITPSKLLFCLNSLLRTYSSLLCICAFFVSTPEYDLIDGLKKLIPVKSLVLILELIFRFIPLLVEEASDIIKTQILRGGLGKVKGGIARIKAVVPLVVPLIIRTIRRSEVLAEAIVMRCFNEK